MRITANYTVWGETRDGDDWIVVRETRTIEEARAVASQRKGRVITPVGRMPDLPNVIR